jgi:cytosine deaminase
MNLLVRNARLRGRDQLVDIGIEHGRITAIAPNLAALAAQMIDAAGDLVVPGFVNLHLHADKALLGEVMRPNLSGTLPEAIEITNEFKRKYDPSEVAQRAGRVIETGINRRIARRTRAAARTREIPGLLRYPGRRLPAGRDRARSRRRRAARRGAQTRLRRGRRPSLVRIFRRGSRQHIDICFDLAKRHDRDIHMLVDDTDDANSRSLEYLALKTMREEFDGRVTASHCGAMAGYNDVYAAKIIDMVATANVTISANTHINLVCSARIDREPKRRGIARVKELLARGVNVVTSQDDVDDPYYPFGKPDQLEVALIMAHTAQLTLPHELEQAFDMVTSNAARAARLPDYGIAPGNKADLVVLGAPSVRQALRLQPPRRHVIKNGVEIARTTVTRELRGP